MPKEGPPGPDFDLKELVKIVKTASWKWPDLAPRGGPRWVPPEDINRGVSILVDVMESEGYQRAIAGGMTPAQRCRWLLPALYHRLLDLKAVSRKAELLDDLALDHLPSGGPRRRRRLHPLDQATLVEKVLSRLSPEERATAAEYLGGDGQGWNGSARTPRVVAPRTRDRHLAKLREVAGAVCEQEGLTREEAADLLDALAAKLAGGAARRKNPRFRGGFRAPRPLVTWRGALGAPGWKDAKADRGPGRARVDNEASRSLPRASLAISPVSEPGGGPGR